MGNGDLGNPANHQESPWMKTNVAGSSKEGNKMSKLYGIPAGM